MWLNCHRPLLTSPSLAGRGRIGYCQRRLFEARGQGDSRLGKSTASQHVRKMGKKVLLAVTGASLLNFRPVHSTNLPRLDFLGDLSIRFRGHRSRRGTRILPGLPTFVTGFPRTSFVTLRRSSSKSAKMRVFNKSFGLAGFFPKRRCATESKLFSPKACVDTERPKSRSKEL